MTSFAIVNQTLLLDLEALKLPNDRFQYPIDGHDVLVTLEERPRGRRGAAASGRVGLAVHRHDRRTAETQVVLQRDLRALHLAFLGLAA